MSDPDHLTPRQLECLRGLASYQTYKEIGLNLGISDSAVEKHVRLARKALGAKSTADALRIFLAAEGKADPQFAKINLAPETISKDEQEVSHPFSEPEQVRDRGDDLTGATDHDPPLSPLQTMSLIVRVALASIIGLTLLIACAEGLKSVLT